MTAATLRPSPLRLFARGDAMRAHINVGRSRRAAVNSSVRVVLDVNWDNSRAVNHPGQSGDPESRHYRDLAPLWSEGRYFPLLYSRVAIEHATERVIRLLPASQ